MLLIRFRKCLCEAAHHLRPVNHIYTSNHASTDSAHLINFALAITRLLVHFFQLASTRNTELSTSSFKSLIIMFECARYKLNKIVPTEVETMIYIPSFLARICTAARARSLRFINARSIGAHLNLRPSLELFARGQILRWTGMAVERTECT